MAEEQPAKTNEQLSRVVRSSLVAWMLSLTSVGLAFGIGHLERWSGPTKAVVWVGQSFLSCASILLPLSAVTRPQAKPVIAGVIGLGLTMAVFARWRRQSVVETRGVVGRAPAVGSATVTSSNLVACGS
jgi:hydrogenase/urease accessory protein HupE